LLVLKASGIENTCISSRKKTNAYRAALDMHTYEKENQYVKRSYRENISSIKVPPSVAKVIFGLALQ
jgi:hypothetical protein